MDGSCLNRPYVRPSGPGAEVNFFVLRILRMSFGFIAERLNGVELPGTTRCGNQFSDVTSNGDVVE